MKDVNLHLSSARFPDCSLPLICFPSERKISESVKVTRLGFLPSHTLWILSQSSYHCTTVLGMLSQDYTYLSHVMSIEVVFDGKDSMLDGNSLNSRLMKLVLFPNFCMHLHKLYKHQKYMYRMMHVYIQVVLEGLLVIPCWFS